MCFDGMYVWMPGAQIGQKRMLGPKELELQVAGNQTRSFRRSQLTAEPFLQALC